MMIVTSELITNMRNNLPLMVMSGNFIFLLYEMNH